MAPQDTTRDGLVAFLPHRLNRQPVVVRGLTADELWVCAGASAAAGLAVGLPLAWITRSIAMVPTMIVAGIAAGVFIGGGILRRAKRGRPDTWLYRQMQWRLALRHPLWAARLGGQGLVTRSGCWTTRRTAPVRRPRGHRGFHPRHLHPRGRP
ncbi:TIGR03750 family conjugal transfer protein [Xanthomonas sontii]|uniref:TIGR03750 family conjugal transfer protein n=1 Tax=Xanthomonas TaxID=338 RepID=UPI0011E49772|nr:MULTISPECIES: TIGR03750 family conjugal transfer protein [Xanthomonas]KAB7773705.1 TIGR03750 family conjugal transfer protein [Xanthomonas sp. LMG 12462]MDQ7759002.1 TIGR03750 family conjugal transfer protein [Xanthomonas sontii]TYD33908.1 TIGR03750 family conjugal transfer protein [Xanthomonas sontii]UZK07817.1 TIGR03750 family conjugal transfer protein [Xanthomonas sontii]